MRRHAHDAIVAVAAIASLTLSWPAGADGAPPPAAAVTPAGLTAAASTPRPVVLPGAEWRVIRAAESGLTYRLYVSRPAGEPPPGGFPVLYVLDGNAVFVTVAQAVRLQSRRPDISGVEPMVVVGIDHDSDELFDADGRYRDLTPASPDGPPKPGPKFKTFPPSGQADRFLRFIEGEVKPLVEGATPINRDRQALFGHSLGGLFALHVLATRPAAFQHVIAVSPSVWWDGERILTELQAFNERAKTAATPGRALVLVGQRELPDMRAGATAAAELLKASPAPGLTTRFEEIPHADHISLLPVAFNRALRFASGNEPWPAPPDGGK